jgi:tetratricopeptide (TPR) repeat protein
MIGILLSRLIAPKTSQPTHLLELAQQQLAAGKLDAAALSCGKVLAIAPDNVDALGTLGAIVSQQGKVADAVIIASQLCRLEPDNPEHPMRAALFHSQLGHRDEARALYRKTLDILRRSIAEHGMSAEMVEEKSLQFQTHRMLCELDLPGESYIDVLGRMHRHLRPRTYVEVGVFKGQTLALSGPATRAIGIDPEPQIVLALNANTQVHALTSDDYFAGHDVRAELGGLPVDMAFIDGMHHFEFALRDFINIERHCSRESVILIHDCYPIDRASAERERNTGFWSGDIWRLVLLLRKYRPDLEVRTIAAMPTGLAMVTQLDPGSRVLPDRLDALTAEYLALDYAHLEGDKEGMLNLFPNEWEKIRAILPAPFSAAAP